MSIELRRRQSASKGQLGDGLSPLLQRLYHARGVTCTEQLDKGLAKLLPWQSLSGIEQAVQVLQTALQSQRKIVIVGDFDADGATSTALCLIALRSMGANNLSYIIPNRFEQGYGLSPDVVSLALAEGAELILTVDNGISSIQGVEVANAAGIEVIITDHHLPANRLPAAAAIVNPNLPECQFASKSLAGVGVAFYLMLALRAALRQAHAFVERPEPNLAELLDLVALGTVADVVPLDSNNRILVAQGLARIRAGQCRAGIKALLEIANRPAADLVASDLGFALGPRLNAAGRLDDMSHGVALLLSTDMGQARILANELDALNQTRKEIEQTMQQEALVICRELIPDSADSPSGMAFYHPDWHQGVVGILASRLKERFNRPIIAFAPAGGGLLKGSGRSIAGVHLRDVLERIHVLYPNLIDKFGGHAMAAGLTLPEEAFQTFSRCFDEVVASFLTDENKQGVIWSDGELSPQEMTLDTATMLRASGPWGQAFPEPVFDGRFRILQQKLLAGRHLKLLLESIPGSVLVDGIAFNIDNSLWPDPSIKEVTLAYRLDVNVFRGHRTLQLMIEHLWP